ncbi:glycosyltransferase family 39 protein [Listeria ilorinensis]|uniref:glycosyltransferase family 39 protein n=1 Tax=Listeria ilorinensis TaxID=2867439 RepID=UPI001EF71385|nr:glycosyltransferase family 39 protein [Listeria ilorinensis]
MNRIQKIVLLIILICATVLSGYVIFMSYFAVSSFWLDIFYGLILCAVLYLVALALKRMYFNRRRIFYISLFLCVTLSRILWIIGYPTTPQGDHVNFHVIASYLADNNSWAILRDAGVLGYATYFTHIMSFSGVLSKIYYIFGNHSLAGQMFNVLLVGLSAVIFFKAVSQRFSIEISISSTLIYAFIPSFFLYSTLVGGEPLFMFLFSICLYLGQKIQSLSFSFFLSAALAFCMVLANLIRPLGIILLLAFLIDSFINQNWSDFIKKMGTLVVVYVCLIMCQPLINHFIYKIPVASNTVGYSLYVGGDEKSEGRYSADDMEEFLFLLPHSRENAIKQNKKLFTNINNQLFGLGIQRYEKMATNGKLLNHFGKKMEHLYFEDIDYGVRWAMLSHVGTASTWNLEKNQTQVSDLSNGFLIVILILNFGTSLLAFRQKDNRKLAIFFLLQLGFTCTFMLVEVQARYQIPFLFSLSLLAMYFPATIRDLIKNKIHSKKENLHYENNDSI